MCLSFVTFVINGHFYHRGHGVKTQRTQRKQTQKSVCFCVNLWVHSLIAMQSKAATVDEYIENLPEYRKAAITALRTVIQ